MDCGGVAYHSLGVLGVQFLPQGVAPIDQRTNSISHVPTLPQNPLHLATHAWLIASALLSDEPSKPLDSVDVVQSSSLHTVLSGWIHIAIESLEAMASTLEAINCY